MCSEYVATYIPKVCTNFLVLMMIYVGDTVVIPRYRHIMNRLFPSFLMLIKTPIQDIAFFFYPTYSSEQNDLMNN